MTDVSRMPEAELAEVEKKMTWDDYLYGIAHNAKAAYERSQVQRLSKLAIASLPRKARRQIQAEGARRKRRAFRKRQRAARRASR